MSGKLSNKIKKLVVKLGSSQIADEKTFKVRTSHLRSLVCQISRLRENNIDVVLVSSGAIALGMGELGEKKRPTQLAQLQARAAIGQTVLMHTYQELFKEFSLKCAQILLTWDDFDNRKRYINAQHTLNAILDEGVIPVINENDTISTDEIKFGDNDKLSALVASALNCDLLVILSDVEGFYNPENKQIFPVISKITPEIVTMSSGTSNVNVARGGMRTKVDAIQVANHAKIPCVIASGGQEDVLIRLMQGERLGTLFNEEKPKILAHKHWIAYSAKPKGKLIVDQGAKQALLTGGKSLLLPGITHFEGHFKVDDVVAICDEDKNEFARGIVSYSVSELHKIDDKKGKQEVVHRDNLVLSQR